MRRAFLLLFLLGLSSAALAQPNPNLPPPAPPVIPPPPLQPLPQVRPPEVAIPSAPVRPTPSTGFHEYPAIGPAPRAVPRRKGYGDRVTPCIERGRAYGLNDREMSAYVGRCAGGD